MPACTVVDGDSFFAQIVIIDAEPHATNEQAPVQAHIIVLVIGRRCERAEREWLRSLAVKRTTFALSLVAGTVAGMLALVTGQPSS
jgi:hypothetical protein